MIISSFTMPRDYVSFTFSKDELVKSRERGGRKKKNSKLCRPYSEVSKHDIVPESKREPEVKD